MRMIEGQQWTFFVQNDYSGDVIARPKLAEDDVDAVEIPISDLERLIAAKVRNRRESELADLDDQEILYG